jgi:hypothetical protein
MADGRLLVVADSPQDIFVDGEYVSTDTTAWVTLDEGYHRVRIGQERHRVYIEDGEEARIWFYNGVVDDGGTVRFRRKGKKKKGHGHHERPADPHDELTCSEPSHNHGHHQTRDTRPGSVEFISRDDEWVNVWVDGAEVAELRNFDSRRQTIELSAGYHTIEVWDFMNSELLVRGKVYVSPGEEVDLGIYEHRVEAYGDDGAWVASR